MCFECRVLGALLVEKDEGKLSRISKEHQNNDQDDGDGDGDGNRFLDRIRQFDFSPNVMEIDSKDLRDFHAQSYLEETLEKLKTEFGVELVPIKVASDGSCLPHAISRCLIGKEILYDILRVKLEQELVQHKSFYKEIFQQGMDDATFDTYWENICTEAKPTHGVMTDRWLGPEHIFGFANLLERPILLLDTPEQMAKPDQSCGLFLPLRHAGNSENKTFPCPLVIGWAGPEKNHFVTLAIPSRNAHLQSEDEELADRVVRACPELWENVEMIIQAKEKESGAETVPIEIPPDKKGGDVCVLRDPKTGKEFTCHVPLGKQPGETFEWTVPNETSAMLTKLKRALVHFYALNPPALRTKSSGIFYKIFSNLIDAVLAADSEKLEKVSTLYLDNKAIRSNILERHGGLEILKAIGFQKASNASSTGREYLKFMADQGNNNNNGSSLQHAYDGLFVAKDCMSFIKNNNDIAYGGGQISFENQAKAFGPTPVYMSEWSENVCNYSHLPKSKVWLFAMGNNDRLQGLDAIRSIVSQLKVDFKALTVGTDFHDMQWDDALLYDQKLKHIRCPNCGRQQYWNKPIDGIIAEVESIQCNDCAQPIQISQTGQRRMSAFVADLFEQQKIALCKDTGLLVLNSQESPPIPPSS